MIVFSLLSGLAKEPKLSAALVPVLHKFAVTQELSPVKVTYVLFFFIHIWKNVAKHVFTNFMVLSPESHFA